MAVLDKPDTEADAQGDEDGHAGKPDWSASAAGVEFVAQSVDAGGEGGFVVDEMELLPKGAHPADVGGLECAQFLGLGGMWFGGKGAVEDEIPDWLAALAGILGLRLGIAGAAAGPGAEGRLAAVAATDELNESGAGFDVPLEEMTLIGVIAVGDFIPRCFVPEGPEGGGDDLPGTAQFHTDC